MADSAEWVAGSAVKLGIFSDFWRGATRPRQKSNKNDLKILAEFWSKFLPNIRPKIPPEIRRSEKSLEHYLELGLVVAATTTQIHVCCAVAGSKFTAAVTS